MRQIPDMPDNSPKLRVLVVEDEPLIRWSLTETLVLAGHSVLQAGDAATALGLLTLTEEAVDVVLLDFRLPDSNDLELLSRVRGLTPASAVVMMTAFGTPEMTEGALRLGVYRVLSKPVDMQDLTQLVIEAHNAARRRQASRSAAG